MARRPIAFTFAFALPLAACAVGPDYHPRTAPELGVPDTYSVPADQRAREDLTRWWEKFDDPHARRDRPARAAANLDIAQAVTRLRQARESLIQSRASLLPSISASAGASRSESLRGGTTTTTLPDGSVTSFSTGGRNNFSLGADASYQVDLFGGVRRGVEVGAGAAMRRRASIMRPS